MNTEITHIIFDLGGVLLNIDLGRIQTGFRNMMDADDEAFKFIKEEVIPLYETGAITTEEFLSKLSLYLKPGFTSDDIVKVWNSVILDMPVERLHMLVQLKTKYHIHLLSNINDLHAHCFELNFRTWFNEDPRVYFDKFFYSHEVGRRKPDSQTYLWVLEQLNSDPEKTLFIDDMPENIEGARNVGIRAYQLTSHRTDVIALVKELGLLAA